MVQKLNPKRDGRRRLSDSRRSREEISKIEQGQRSHLSNIIIIIIIIIFLHGLGRSTCFGIDALPSFPGASTISSSSRFVVEGVFREAQELCFSHKSCASACKTSTTQNQLHQISNTQRTENKTTDVVIQQQSRRLLKMDVLMSETC